VEWFCLKHPVLGAPEEVGEYFTGLSGVGSCPAVRWCGQWAHRWQDLLNYYYNYTGLSGNRSLLSGVGSCPALQCGGALDSRARGAEPEPTTQSTILKFHFLLTNFTQYTVHSTYDTILYTHH
jgi:hypothetical protein